LEPFAGASVIGRGTRLVTNTVTDPGEIATKTRLIPILAIALLLCTFARSAMAERFTKLTAPLKGETVG